MLAVSNPRQFGRIEHPAWALDSGLTEIELAWARLQHRAAYVAGLALKEQGMTLDDLAARAGESPSWVRRKLTGQVPADIGDLVLWAKVLGVDVWPVLGETDLH